MCRKTRPRAASEAMLKRSFDVSGGSGGEGDAEDEDEDLDG